MAVTSVNSRTGAVILTAADAAAGTFPGDVVITSGSTGTTQSAADSSTKLATTAFVTTADNLKANLASPTFTGSPVLPTGTTGTTQTAADNSTKLATTAYVDTAAALKANLAGPTFTGTPTLPTGTIATTQAASNNSTAIATTAYVDTADALKANLASPTFTGTPTLPTGTIATTQATTDSSTKIATTAFVAGRSGQVGGPPTIVIRTGDSGTISSNATPGNDDTLLWAVGASDRWFFECFALFTAAAGGGNSATADLKVGWSVPTGGAMQWGALGATGTGFGGYGNVTTSSTPLVVLAAAGTLSSGMTNGSVGLGLAGFYTGDGSHAGNVNFQWSQDTSNAATLLIAKNSMIMAWRIA